MHPDAIPLLAELLRTMSERTQVVITTHSPELVDQFTSEPEAVIVCERGFEGDTQLRRLSRDELADWLSDYRLGELWKKGVLGGNRW
jgi:predicted ATPase